MALCRSMHTENETSDSPKKYVFDKLFIEWLVLKRWPTNINRCFKFNFKTVARNAQHISQLSIERIVFFIFFFCIGYVLVATFHTMMSNFVLLGCYERRAGKFVFVCLCWVTHVFSNITISTNKRTSSKLRRWMAPIRFVVCIVSFLHLFQPEIVYLMLTHPRQCRFQCGKLKNTFEWKEESEEDVAQCEKYGIVCGLNAYKLPRKFQNANGWLTWHSVVINVSISGNNRSGRCWNDKLKTQKKLMESLKWCYFCWPSQLHSTNYKIKLIAYQCDAKAAGKQQIGKMNSS